MDEKPRLERVSDPGEVAAVQAGRAGDLAKPFGITDGEGNWWALGDELARYRKAFPEV